MKLETLDKIAAKARKKKDGIYCHSPYQYYVRDGKVLFFVENAQIYEVFGNFTTAISKQFDFNGHAIKYLKELVKK